MVCADICRFVWRSRLLLIGTATFISFSLFRVHLIKRHIHSKNSMHVCNFDHIYKGNSVEESGSTIRNCSLIMGRNDKDGKVNMYGGKSKTLLLLMVGEGG